MIIKTLLCVLAISYSALLSPAQAQTSQPPALADTSELKASDLARLSDSELRQLILAKLEGTDTVSSSTQAPELDDAVDLARGLGGAWWAAVVKITNYPKAFGHAFSEFRAERSSQALFVSICLGLLALIFGFGAAIASRKLFRRANGLISANPPSGLGQRVGVLALRFVLDSFEVIVFAIVAMSLSRLWLSHANDLFTFDSILPIIAVAWLFRNAARFVFAPHRPDLRLVDADDILARYLARQITIIGLLGPASSYIVGWTWEFGLAPGQTQFGFWLNLALHLTAAWTVWQVRTQWPQLLGANDPALGVPEQRILNAWPNIALVLLFALWISIEIIAFTGNIKIIGPNSIYLTVFVILFLPVFDTAARALVREAYPIHSASLDTADPIREETQKSLSRIARVIMAMALIAFVTSLWSINLASLAEAGFGVRLAQALFGIVLILFFTFAAFEIINILINRALASELAQSGGAKPVEAGEVGGAGGTRLETVLPLLRGTLKVTLGMLCLFTILGELGVNITPLLAGAGVIGLAIGFGAQTFVQDVVSGLFFLIDDAFRVGEYIEIGETRGSVERISIRSLRLRHHRGPVHTIPYGQIAKLTNYSRDWAVTKVRFRVPFDTDIRKVKKIFKQIGQELLNHPEHGENFIQPFKSQGVYEIDDSGIVVNGKFMTKPGTQFLIRREVYQQVQAAFDEAGIPFQRKEVRVQVPGLEHLKPEEAERVVSAAGAAAADDAQQADKSPA